MWRADCIFAFGFQFYCSVERVCWRVFLPCIILVLAFAVVSLTYCTYLMLANIFCAQCWIMPIVYRTDVSNMRALHSDAHSISAAFANCLLFNFEFGFVFSYEFSILFCFCFSRKKGNEFKFDNLNVCVVLCMVCMFDTLPPFMLAMIIVECMRPVKTGPFLCMLLSFELWRAITKTGGRPKIFCLMLIYAMRIQCPLPINYVLLHEFRFRSLSPFSFQSLSFPLFVHFRGTMHECAGPDQSLRCFQLCVEGWIRNGALHSHRQTWRVAVSMIMVEQWPMVNFALELSLHKNLLEHTEHKMI